MGRLAGFITLLLGLAAVIAAWWWLGQERDDGGDNFGRPPFVLPVTLTTVELDDIHPSITLTGTVRSSRWANLALEVSGTVSELFVRKADPVRQGQQLARLADEDHVLELARSEADLAVSRSNLARLAAGERSEVLSRLAAEVDAAAAEATLAKLEVERRQTLAASNDVSRSELDRALATEQAAAAREMGAVQRLAEAEAGTRREDLDVAAAQVKAAAARRDQALRARAKTVLSAPWDGTIVRRYHSVGDVLAPGAPLFELADLAHLEIEVEIPAEYALRLGDKPAVVLTVDEAPDFNLAAVLDAAVPTADRITRNFLGLVRLTADAATQAVLHPGMFVRIELALRSATGVTVVASDAVRITDDGPVVVVADEAGSSADASLVARFVPVRIVASADGRSAVQPLAGELNPGDRVVLTGVDSAYPGVPLGPRTSRDHADSADGAP